MLSRWYLMCVLTVYFTVEVESRNMEVHRTGYLTSNVLTTSEEGTYFCRAYFETYTIESERASVSLVRKFNHSNHTAVFQPKICLRP